MTLLAGSVSVAAGEVVTGSGMALAIYNEDAATLTLPTVPTLGSTAAPYTVARPVQASDRAVYTAARLGALQDAARRATAYAVAIVATLQADGIGL